ncbi:MAG TPA: TolC family protein [Polyangiaceae bacterium]|nr:TolC family protein [Polyangiaceae bacterium]
MFHVPFVRGSARALCVTSLCSLSACGGTAGANHYQARSADYERSAAIAPRDASQNALPRGEILEREAFVRAVLARNPSIESARQGWRAALARVRQSGAFSDPMVELQLAPLSLTASKVPLGYEVMVSQAFPWFGKRSLDASVADAEAQAAKSDFEGTKRELALTALTLYDQYFVTYRSLEIHTEHVALMQAIRDAASAQFSSGRGSAQDTLQAEAELTHMEHDAVVLGFQRDVLIAQMNELLHRPPSEALPPPPATLEVVPPGADRTTPQLEEDAVHGRPEIAAARQRARAAQARADRADQDSYPDLTLSTSYNSMWEMPEHRWMVGLGFNLPVFSGKRAGMAEEARAMQAQFQSDASRMSDMARTQTYVALKQLQESDRVLQLYDTRLLPIARERIDAARAGFITGQNPFMAVIEAEKNLRSVELEYQMARADYAGRRGQLDRALGRIPGLSAKESDR